MGRRTGLREFQLSVAERLRTAATSQTAVASKLGFQVGGENWFVALHEAVSYTHLTLPTICSV